MGQVANPGREIVFATPLDPEVHGPSRMASPQIGLVDKILADPAIKKDMMSFTWHGSEVDMGDSILSSMASAGEDVIE